MTTSRLRAGDWVEVKSAEEILATLDQTGSLDALPFMPEMLQYCGKRFKVFKSAHKTCDTINDYTIRRMANTVHLENLRCDGQAHDGCQAGCLLFWKEAWLKPVDGRQRAGRREPSEDAAAGTTGARHSCGRAATACDVNTLRRAARVPAAEEGGESSYRCQATELVRATFTSRWWEPQPYVDDLASRNVRPRDFVRYGLLAAFNTVIRLLRRANWRLRPYLQPYPDIRGLANGQTPSEALNLRAGDWVQVRSKDEIMRSLNEAHRNRGLWFDVEMVPYCGRTFRVLRRAERFIDDRTGQMTVPRSPCLILEGVTCRGYLSRNRLFCPRGLYPYWHEIWLRRVDQTDATPGACAPQPRDTHAGLDRP